MPATGVRPPDLMLAAVRAIAPVAGMPPNSAEPTLPMPCAISSVLELWWEATMPSATTQDKRLSIAAKMAMVKALGSIACTVSKEKSGGVKEGSLLEMV